MILDWDDFKKETLSVFSLKGFVVLCGKISGSKFQKAFWPVFLFAFSFF